MNAEALRSNAFITSQTNKTIRQYNFPSKRKVGQSALLLYFYCKPWRCHCKAISETVWKK